MKLSLILMFFLHFSISANAAENEQKIPLCGMNVASRFVHEVKDPQRPDKYSHCSISCVITLYCGSVEAFEVGVLKEVYDAMGFGDPDIKDLKADVEGIQTALKLKPLASRKECYQACAKIYP